MEKRDYNSTDLEYEQIMVYLSLGFRTPQNEKEEELLKQIEEIHRKGRTMAIPSNGIY